MKDILNEGMDRIKNAKRLILCPNTDLYEVRKFLSDNMFMIEFEEMIHEHKFYEIIVAKYTGQAANYSEIELKYGPHLLQNKSEEFISNLKLQHEMLTKQIALINDLKAKEKLTIKINEISNILGNNL